MRPALLATAALLVVAGCARSGDDATGAVSAEEAAQLNDAAAMLDANSIDLDTLHASANESTPDAR